MNFDTEPTFDDHPDMFINPVLMYQIKIEREQQREKKKLVEQA